MELEPVTDQPFNDAALASDNERMTLLIAYVLDVLAPFTGFLLAVVSVIISHIKVKETANDFIRSHHSWLIRTFWWNFGLGILCVLLSLVLIGYFGLMALVVWWLYRVIRGLINYSNYRPMLG